jgi:hypothetical protein
LQEATLLLARFFILLRRYFTWLESRGAINGKTPALQTTLF